MHIYEQKYTNIYTALFMVHGVEWWQRYLCAVPKLCIENLHHSDGVKNTGCLLAMLCLFFSG